MSPSGRYTLANHCPAATKGPVGKVGAAAWRLSFETMVELKRDNFDTHRSGGSEPQRQGGARRSLNKPRVIPEDELTANVKTVLSALEEEVERLRRDLEISHRRVEELENIADEDPLVPILNRRAFEREMVRATAYAKRYKTPASLLYFDLDGFKDINDSHGHLAGDAVLRRVADVLTTQVRKSDVVARIGGDEFAVILVQAGAEMANLKAQRLIETVTSEPVLHDGVEIPVGISAGVAEFREDDDLASLLDRADRAMYRQKERRPRT